MYISGDSLCFTEPSAVTDIELGMAKYAHLPDASEKGAALANAKATLAASCGGSHASWYVPVL
jgi:hypothetical protein